MMASSSVIAKRRQDVSELWLRGVPVHRIASMMKRPDRTIRDDIVAIRQSLQAERTEELERYRDRSVAVLRKVQQEAWTLYYRLDDASTSKIGALNVISAAEERISKLLESYTLDDLMHMAEEIKLVLAEQGYHTKGARSNGHSVTI